MVRVIRVEDVIGQAVFKTCVLIAITYFGARGTLALRTLANPERPRSNETRQQTPP
jgi:hypothetical protein